MCVTFDKEKRQFQELFPDVPLEEDEAIFKKKKVCIIHHSN